MNSQRENGLEVVRSMLGNDVASALEASIGSTQFGALRGELAVDFVFGKLWSRPGLDRRARSLVTLGILIGAGQTLELKVHLLAALRNGCSINEIEEVLYHSAAYAGFPRANEASLVAEQLFKEQSLID